MNTNTLTRFKTILSGLFLICSNANAQLGKKLERKPRPAGQESKQLTGEFLLFVSQTWGTERYESKNIEYRAAPKLVLSKKVIQIPAKD